MLISAQLGAQTLQEKTTLNQSLYSMSENPCYHTRLDSALHDTNAAAGRGRKGKKEREERRYGRRDSTRRKE